MCLYPLGPIQRWVRWQCCWLTNWLHDCMQNAATRIVCQAPRRHWTLCPWGVWQGHCRGEKVCRWRFWCRAVIRYHNMVVELGGTSLIWSGPIFEHLWGSLCLYAESTDRLIFSFISGDPLCTTMVGYWYLVHLTKRLWAAGLSTSLNRHPEGPPLSICARQIWLGLLQVCRPLLYRGVNLVGNLGDDDRLLSGPNFLLAKLAMLK